jgi:chromate reductase
MTGFNMTNSYIFLIGSQRENSYTARCVEVLMSMFNEHKNVKTIAFNPYEQDLNWSLSGDADNLKVLKRDITDASGIILATPEYHGSYSSTLKWIIDHLGYPSVIAHKPVGLIGVASGELGAVKALEHLRGVCAHIGAYVMPKAISIPRVELFIDQTSSVEHHRYRKRMHQWTADFLSFTQNIPTRSLS